MNNKVLDINNFIKNGLIVGKNFNYRTDCVIDPSFCFLITIGDNVTFESKVQILAHDASSKIAIGHTKVGLVSIGNDVYIGQNSIILPNVKIGSKCIIGPGCVINKDIPDNSVVYGNQVISTYDEYVKRNKFLLDNRPIYDSNWKIGNESLTDDMKNKMKDDLKNGIGFIE